MIKSIYAIGFACLMSVGYANAQFTSDDIQIWVGEGGNEAVIVFDFLDDGASSFAWGYRFDDGATAGDALSAIDAADENLDIDMETYLNDISYIDFVGIGGSPNYWATFSGTNFTNWAMNSSIETELVDGDWFGCSYTDFDPAIVPGEPVAAVGEVLPFTADDVLFWIGEGSNEAVIVIDFLDDTESSFAWGYRFDGSATSGDAMSAINDADEELTIDMAAFLNDISYQGFVGLGGNPNYWGTWSGTSSDDWESNSGLDVELTDGDWFGCSYTDFNPAIVPAEPVAAEVNESVFDTTDVLFWVGEGSNEAIVVIDFQDGENSSLAWGYKFNGTATGGEALSALDAADDMLSIAYGAFLNDIFYMDFDGVGGSPNYWGTYSGTNFTDWVMNSGIDTELEDGSWFGCSYTDFDPEILPNEPIAAENNNVELGPYAPAAEQAGSTAIASDDDTFISWAITCEVVRGSQDLSDDDAIDATYGSEDDAIGIADGLSVVSLGDGGVATLTFSPAISNGAGADFAVFENALGDTFLELGFVEVSSDGINYIRFPSISLIQNDIQIDGFGETDPTYIYNFAGKYRTNFGTPFDLEELAGTAGLDINQITHVRIIDVVGSIDDDYGTYDSEGNIINGPFPTAFESGGFDLDAVGVINTYVGIAEYSELSFSVFPNPAISNISVVITETATLQIIDASGRIVLEDVLASGRNQLDILELSSGIYSLNVISNEGIGVKQLIVI